MSAVLAAAPRAVEEIQGVDRALRRVQDELEAVDARVTRAADSCVEAKTLEELDRLKDHLESVGATIVEAASWRAAANGAADALRAFLAAGDAAVPADDAPSDASSGIGAASDGAPAWAPPAEAVAERLSAMAASEKVLRRLPDADERRNAVATLREDLEAALAPKLAAALDRGADAALPRLAVLYKKLGLGDALRRAYAARRPGDARKRWYGRRADISSMESRRCGRRDAANSAETSRGGAAAATRLIPRRRVASPRPPRRGDSAETSRETDVDVRSATAARASGTRADRTATTNRWRRGSKPSSSRLYWRT